MFIIFYARANYNASRSPCLTQSRMHDLFCQEVGNFGIEQGLTERCGYQYLPPMKLLPCLARIKHMIELGLDIGETRVAPLLERLGVRAPASEHNLPLLHIPRPSPEQLDHGSADHLISIIMPVYNRGHLVDMPIRSLLSQSYPRWQLVAVDDGSNDNSLERLLHWQHQDKRILVARRPHAGVCQTRNTALDLAEGSLITFLDSDDRWHSDFLAAMYTAWKQQDKARVVYCDHILYNRNGMSEMRHVPFSFAALHKQPQIDLCSIMVERALLDETGSFNKDMDKWVDYELILRLAHHTPFLHLPHYLLHYYRLTDGITRQISQLRMSHNKAAIRATRRAYLKVGLVLDEHTAAFVAHSQWRKGLAKLSLPDVPLIGPGDKTLHNDAAFHAWVRDNGLTVIHIEASTIDFIQRAIALARVADRPFTLAIHGLQKGLPAHRLLGAVIDEAGCRCLLVSQECCTLAPDAKNCAVVHHPAAGADLDQYLELMADRWTN